LRSIAQNGTSGDSRTAMATPAATEALDAQQILPMTLPPSRGQKQLALAVVLVLLAAFCATVPFAAVPVGYIREFIPAYATAMFVISSITSALLFVQFSVVHSRALLAVCGGYLFQRAHNHPLGSYLSGPVRGDRHGGYDMGSAHQGLASCLSAVRDRLHFTQG